MTKQILKTVLAGILFGTAMFMVPIFLIKVFAFFLLIKLAFNLLGFGRRNRFKQHFKNMSDEEKSAYMKNMANNCCGGYRYKTEAPTQA